MTKTGSKPAGSPDDLLRAAVSGGTASEPAAARAGKVSATLSAVPAWARREARVLGISGAALCAGALLGAGAMALLSRPAHGPGDAVAALGRAVEAGRTETARLGGDVAQLHQILADLRAAADAGRKDTAGRGAALGERVAQAERAVSAKIAGLGDRLDQAEREQGARIAGLAAQIERRAAAPTAAAAKAEPPRTEPSRPEPAQTGSLPEPRPEQKVADNGRAEAKPADAKAADARPKPAAPERPPVVDAWAVRDVYDGAAILENRRRRLVEVAPGDLLPGVGRIEGVERRGREWVVVTRQGLITPQPW